MNKLVKIKDFFDKWLTDYGDAIENVVDESIEEDDDDEEVN